MRRYIRENADWPMLLVLIVWAILMRMVLIPTLTAAGCAADGGWFKPGPHIGGPVICTAGNQR
jgi:hypothetical protein